MFIEQAIFASAITDRAEGYQLVGRSPGLSEAEARELTAWGPSHESLLETSGAPLSVNFHQLANGMYCVSRTTQSGAEYSGRGGASVYTQFLMMSADVLRRFANNPFAVLRAATAAGLVLVYEQIPEVLEPLRLGGRSAVVDLPLLAQLAREPGPGAMATLIQAALSSDRLAIAAKVPMEQLIAGLISALPVECRTQLSFSTGLRFCSRRTVRISGLGDDKASWRPMGRAGFTLLSLERGEQADDVGWQGWAGHIAGILATGKISVLATELEQSRPGLSCADLDNLAETLEAQRPTAQVEPVEPASSAAPNGRLRIVGADDESSSPASRADGAYVAGEPAVADAADSARPYLAATLSTQSPETVEMLERVDDLVFAAIAGNEQALADLEVLWPTITGQLSPDLIEQSREQYLRCALAIWSQCVDEQVHRPERAVAAIDVLCVLFEE